MPPSNHYHNNSSNKNTRVRNSASAHCAVCGGLRGGFFFGVHSCRPCASFFRRSIREGRQYVCRQQGNCAIQEEGMRNSCRHCRLKYCIRAGMNAEQAMCSNNYNRCDAISGGNTSKSLTYDNTSSPTAMMVTSSSGIVSDASFDASPPQIGIPSSDTVTLTFALKTPLAHQLAHAWREYTEGFRAVCAQQYGLGHMLVGNAGRLINHVESLLLEQMGAPLLLTLVRTLMPAFDLLGGEQKRNLMKDFVLHFYMLTASEWTDKDFWAQSELNQLVLFPGCLMDKDKYEQFFEGTHGLGREDHIKIGQPLLVRHLHFIQHRYRPLRITPAEVALLAGIFFWDCAINCLGIGTKQKEQLYVEMHSLCIQHALQQNNANANTLVDSSASANTINASAIPVRFGQLMSIQIELLTLAKELQELFALSNVFLNDKSFVNFTEVWDEIFGSSTNSTTTTTTI